MGRKNAWLCIVVVALAFTIGRDRSTNASESERIAFYSASADLNHLLFSVDSAEAELRALGRLANLSVDRVRTVYVADLINGNDESSQALEESMMAHEHHIYKMQQILSTRRSVLAALQKGALQVNQVVALHVENDGRVDLYCK